MKKSDSKTKIIWLLYCLVLLTGILFFNLKYHPTHLFNTDDWTYLTFQRNNRFVPSVTEWNPIKVFPENLMPISGYAGRYLIFPVLNDFYTSISCAWTVVLCLFVFAYFVLTLRVLLKLFDINIRDAIILSMFIVLIHYIPFVTSKVYDWHFFYGCDATETFNYIIPALLNMTIILLSIIHEEHLKDFLVGNHWICKIIYLILIYLAVYSNLYSSIVIATYAFAKIVQYVFMEHAKRLINRCAVHFYTLYLWIRSMNYEIHGGRARSMAGVPFNLKGTLKAYGYSYIRKNPCYLVVIAIGVIFYLCVAYYMKRNYEKLDNRGDEERLLVRYFNNASIMMISFSLSSAYLILLAAKTNPEYIQKPGVQLDYNFFLLMNTFMMLTFLIKKNRKWICISIAYTIVIITTLLNTHADHTKHVVTPYEEEYKYKRVADYILQQYLDADLNGYDQVMIRVPYYDTPDNFPLANYGGERIGKTLYKYKMISGPIDSQFVIDNNVNVELELGR